MFIGHFAVAFAAKAAVPRASLGTLFLAAQFVDLLWPTLLLLGFETVRINPSPPGGPPLDFVDYPISHSLAGVLVWSALFFAIHFLRHRQWRNALVLGGLVLSHWLFDLAVHHPDLPLYPGAPDFLGFALWAHPVRENLLEFAMLAVGVFLYLRTTRALDNSGRRGLWALVVLLCLIQAGNSLAMPPPNAAAVAWVGEAQWLLVAWAWWVDRHRDTGLRL